MSKVFTITEGLENMGALRTGGQGSVYKARRVGPIVTAVKLIPTPIHNESEDDKNFRNFTNEVKKLKKVNQEPNPNVVKILSSGITESGAFPFIEMEYIEGPDLEELLKPPHDSIFTIKETIKVADQLACALNHCHKVGVKHGDIKSNNVKFNIHSGNYVLLDFGLAVMSDEQRRSSMRNAGAIEFMAPEQNEGQMLFSTDVYSYGIILYELLAGQVPFPLNDGGETARNTVRLQHIETPVPDLMALRRKNLPEAWPEDKKLMEMQVPDWLLALISRCLSKKPDERYTNGIELHEALSRNSISGSTNAELIAENERLKALLKTSDAPVIDTPTPPGVQVSKPLFTLLVILLIGFMAVSVYFTLFYKGYPMSAGVTTPPVDTVAHNDSLRQLDRNNELNTTPLRERKDPQDTDSAARAKQQFIPDTSIKPQVDTSGNNMQQPDGNNMQQPDGSDKQQPGFNDNF